MLPDRSSWFSRKVVLMNVIATFLIVLLHSETPLRFGQSLDLGSHPFIFTVFTLTQTAVPLFFFISALLFYRGCEWKDIPRKLYRRIFSLLIPFLLRNLIWGAVYWALARIPFTAGRMSLATPLDTPLQWLDAVWNTRFTPLWFIKYLIFFCLLSPAVMLLIRNKWVGTVAVAGLLTACVLLHWDSFSLEYWAPVYLAGALAGRHLYKPGSEAESGPVVRGPAAAVCFGAAFLGIYAVAVLHQELWVWWQFAGPLLIWYGFDAFAGRSFGEKFTVRPWMGATFFIYATHYFLINSGQTLVRSFLPASPAVLNITFILTPLVTIPLILLVARWARDWKIYKILTGGR